MKVDILMKHPSAEVRVDGDYITGIKVTDRAIVLLAQEDGELPIVARDLHLALTAFEDKVVLYEDRVLSADDFTYSTGYIEITPQLYLIDLSFKYGTNDFKMSYKAYRVVEVCKNGIRVKADDGKTAFYKDRDLSIEVGVSHVGEAHVTLVGSASDVRDAFAEQVVKYYRESRDFLVNNFSFC